jgi:choline dehydrogenase
MGDYDVIVVGGGSAGVALAARLSEHPQRRVLLVEAGADHGHVTDDDRLGDQMAFASTLTHWGIEASFVPGGALNYPQGHSMGGGSAVNGAFAMHGLPDDYERWARVGGDAWSWPNMQRMLQRLEADQDFPGGIHGSDGPVPVARWRRDDLLAPQQTFLDAVLAQGIGWVDDMNDPATSGVGVVPMNRKDGVRMSTALSYLPAARGRSNLTIRANTRATRVVVEAGRAVGVELRDASGVEVVVGDRIVVSSGSIHSPALLMRSGIGPAAHLREHGIACVADLPGVGSNLMDHPGTAVFVVPKGPLPAPDARVLQLGARWTSSAGTARDDMWFSMWGTWELAAFPDMAQAFGVPAISSVVAGIHDPASRGTVRLRSADPATPPQVDFNMLDDPLDMERMVEGLRRAIEIATSPAFAAAYTGIGLLDPSCVDDRATLEGYLRSTVGGWYHASGTCRLGTDPDTGAVVDGGLRVHGVDGLFVADSSIMPTVVRSPTNLSSIAIGERAAELLA